MSKLCTIYSCTAQGLPEKYIAVFTFSGVFVITLQTIFERLVQHISWLVSLILDRKIAEHYKNINNKNY